MTDQSPDPTIAAQAQAQLDEQMAAVARRRQAEAAPAKKAPEPLPQVIRRRTDNLRAALGKTRQRDRVRLPELSQNTPDGSTVELRVRRLTVQELAASDMLPRRTDQLVTALINKGMEATQQPRKEMGLADAVTADDVNEIVGDLYGGWTRDAVAAFFEFQCVVCCAAVIDDDYRLYLTQEEVDADPQRGVLVWDLPDPDVEAIFSWVFEQEALAERAVLPFRDGGAAGGALRPEPEPAVPAARADRV